MRRKSVNMDWPCCVYFSNAVFQVNSSFNLPLASYKYKLKGPLTFTDLIDHTASENRNVTPSERGLHCIFFHWIRVVCHSTLLAP